MELKHWVFGCAVLVVCWGLPTSLVDEIKAGERRDGAKVKRAQLSDEEEEEQHGRAIPYFSKPTAIKRSGPGMKSPSIDQQALNEWEAEQSFYHPSNLASLQSGLYNTDLNEDDKSTAEYEKGFRYGTNKDKLDEAIENAVLKSELYGDPVPSNQYRYYNDRRRRRRDVKRSRLDGRMKRDTDLTPEEILTILSLYENEHQNYRPYAYQTDSIESQEDNDDESWLDSPVYPHSSGRTEPSDYFYEKRSRWGGLNDRKKRFMVAKKRNDPTRELRYLNGPNKNDYYTLSQLLSGQREPDVPLYHRMVL